MFPQFEDYLQYQTNSALFDSYQMSFGVINKCGTYLFCGKNNLLQELVYRMRDREQMRLEYL